MPLRDIGVLSLLHVNVMEIMGNKVEIVIANSQVDYLLPVTTDFKADCCMPEAGEWERFLKMLQKKGKGRLRLSARIMQDGQFAWDYMGVFVALIIGKR